MENNVSKKIVSMMIIIMMLIGIMPINVLAASDYTKLGDISEVIATAEIMPVIGQRVQSPSLVITNLDEEGARFGTIEWQRLNSEGEWESYYNMYSPNFFEGSYRLKCQLRSDSNEANEYYALQPDVTLSVNGIPWTVEQELIDVYESNGCGWIYFVSPEIIVSESGQSSKKLDSIAVTIPPKKVAYVGGEDFDTTGMIVKANYDDSTTAYIENYTITDGKAMSSGKTDVTISYTENGITRTTTQEILVAKEVEDEIVFEVYSWRDFNNAFAEYNGASGKKYTIKLMKNLSCNLKDEKRNTVIFMNVNIKGNFVTFDFNGHTLSCTDDVSETDLESQFSDFIRINMYPEDHNTPSELRIIDSVGGGGINMYSSRAYDSQLAALHVVGIGEYCLPNGVFQTCSEAAKLYIDGGEYELSAKTKYGYLENPLRAFKGTLAEDNYYRGLVIADNIEYVEINDGTFVVESDGAYFEGDDMCARELSAFATCSNKAVNLCGTHYGHTVINGGTFISDGYAIHHFDHSWSTDESRSMLLPQINGGIFSGSVGYVGMSFVYENYDTTKFGVEELREIPASNIISDTAVVRCIKNGKMYELEDLTVGDLHEASSLYVFSDSYFGFDTLPETGDVTELERNIEQSDLFKVVYNIPEVLKQYEFISYISITPNGGGTTTYVVEEKTINYADYPAGLTVELGIAMPIAGETLKYERSYTISVTEEKKPAEIVKQPVSVTVEPGDYASATVVANCAKSYQWYILVDRTPLALTDSVVSALDIDIEGFTSPTLSISVDGITEDQYYCEVTGTDGVKVKTNKIYLTFGGKPIVKGMGGGIYNPGEDAQFNIWAKYAEDITWYVVHRMSGNFSIYTLDEFSELTGCEYELKKTAFPSKMFNSTVTFKNAKETWANNYYVGYKLTNSVGEIAFNPDNTVPFVHIMNANLTPSATEITVGDEITFTATATGGSRSYTYSFLMYDEENDVWERIVDFDKNSSISWEATISGNKIFCVEVKDSYGTIVKSESIEISVEAVLNGLVLQENGEYWYFVEGVLQEKYTGLLDKESEKWYVVNGVFASEYTGLIKYDGIWWYVENGVVNTSYTGLAENAYGTWYVKNGQLDRTYTGMVKDASGVWWYVVKGKVDLTYTGMAKNSNGWWYMTNGKLDRTYTGIAENAKGKWYMKAGCLDLTYTGMAKDASGVWWYVVNGKVDETYTGIAENAKGKWYMKEGCLDLTYTGMAKDALGVWWYVVNGKVDETYTGIAENANGKWYIKAGCVDLTYTGMAKDASGEWWYIVDGKVDETYTGIAENANGKWYMKNGKLDRTVNGLIKTNLGWAYVTNGKLNTSYTGMVKNSSGWWYVKEGKLDLTYTGMATNKYGIWYMKNGKLDTTVGGLIKTNLGWVYLTKGMLDTSYTGMAKDSNGWWYVKEGKLDLKYTGMATNKYGIWYMKNGKLDTTVNGFIKTNLGWVYLTKGMLDTSYTGMVKNGNGWWYVKEGRLDLSYTGLATNKNGTWYMKKGKLDFLFNGNIVFNGVTYKIVNGKVVK